MKSLALGKMLLVITAAGAPAAFAQATQPVAPATQPPHVPPTTFKSGVELVALTVTVTDQSQNYVAGLNQTDFAVYEDGVRQELSFFAASELPLDLILLIDHSGSMADKMSIAREAALGFLRTMRAVDRAAIVAFNESVRVLQPLTEDRAQLESSLAGVQPSGATALHNAIYVSLRQFGRAAKQSGEVRRQAIAVFSDGEDTASAMSIEDLLEQARRSGVSVYTIALQSPSAAVRRGGARRYYSQSDHAMKTLAQETGAQAFFPERIQELAGVYNRIATELGSQVLTRLRAEERPQRCPLPAGRRAGPLAPGRASPHADRLRRRHPSRAAGGAQRPVTRPHCRTPHSPRTRPYPQRWCQGRSGLRPLFLEQVTHGVKAAGLRIHTRSVPQYAGATLLPATHQHPLNQLIRCTNGGNRGAVASKRPWTARCWPRMRDCAHAKGLEGSGVGVGDLPADDGCRVARVGSRSGRRAESAAG